MVASKKIAIVTGGGSGIGRACALAFLKDGYSIVLAGRRLEPLIETISMAPDRQESALAVPTDVRKPDEVAALFETTMRVFGRLDLLFNNAGIAAASIPIEDLPYEAWASVVDTNLTGSFLCAQQAIKSMKAQIPVGGRIINNGSVSAHVPRPNSAPYTATKHSLTGLTKSISLDGRKHRIVCSQIDIGNAATGMIPTPGPGMMQANGESREEPTFDVEHVAQAVLFIANLPLEANIQFMTVLATTMPYIGRG